MNESAYDRLLNKVRENNVVLWIGSGFSKCAGFPIGVEVIEKIKERCTDYEKNVLERDNILPDFAEKFVKLRGGNRADLLNILEDIFKVSISDEMLKYHKKLNGIPQIDTIITTNYDELIEKAYGDENITVIRTDKDISRIRDNKKKLYKIHSDFNNIEDIVITRSDYTNFFDEKMRSLIWNKIKSIISEKTILFIGYSLGDQNVSYIFTELIKKLGDLTNESFIVAPNMAEYEITDLNRKKITYINSTGEDFISKLEDSIKDKLVEDCEAGKVSVKNVEKIFEENGMGVQFSLKDNEVQLSSVSQLDKNVEGKINITFGTDENTNEFNETMKKLNDIFIGKSFDSLMIPAEFIKKAKNTFNGIDIMPLDEKELEHIQILYKPNCEEKTIWDLYFNDEEYIQLDVEVYHSDYLLQTKAQCKYFKLIIKTDLEKIDDKLILKETTVTATINSNLSLMESNKFFKILKNWIEGQPMVLFEKDNYKNKIDVPYDSTLPNQKEFISFVEQSNFIYSNLVLFQKYFGVKFDKFDEITYMDLMNISNLSEYCSAQGIFNIDQVPIYSEKANKLGISETKELKVEFELIGKEEKIELLGKEINIGKAIIKCDDAYIAGHGVDKNDPSKECVLIKSKSDTMKMQFIR